MRGAGSGVASFLNRVMGFVAPLIATSVAGNNTEVFYLVSGCLYAVIAVSVYFLPIETNGKPLD